jgi:hypothetical protein
VDICERLFQISHEDLSRARRLRISTSGWRPSRQRV